MKKILLTSLLLITAVLSAQNLSKATSQKEVIKNATELIGATNSLQFEASKLFTEENKFVVKFSNASSYALVTYNQLKEQNSESYVFVSATGTQEDIKAIWKQFTKSDKEKYFDKTNNIVYYLAETDDDKWIIQQQSLK